MPPKARWCHPVNFRSEDGDLLAKAIEIAKHDQTTLTEMIRTAMRNYVQSKALPEGTPRLDSFFVESSVAFALLEEKLLGIQEVQKFSDEELLRLSKRTRARQQTLEAELRKRGFYFRW
jgi:hypothetical protein